AIELTQMMSASGVRYGNKDYELSGKGREASLEEHGVRIAANCQAVEPRSPTDGVPPLTEADAGKPIQLKVGQTVHFNLPVEAGAGFSWEASGKSPDLELEFGKETAVAQPGAPASQPVTAKATNPVYLVLKFQYARPSEKGTASARRLRFPILITE
ncbi:MAG: protease inhibitor I42 family protein, partial [Bryobacteraceae bacterium]